MQLHCYQWIPTFIVAPLASESELLEQGIFTCRLCSLAGPVAVCAGLYSLDTAW